MKNIILKKIWNGILYGSAMFALSLLLIDYVFDNWLTVFPHQYTRIVLGAICIGVGFALSSMIYEEDRMPFFSRTLIQLLICAVTVLLAFVISGGMPDGPGFGIGSIFVLVEIGVGFAFWIGSIVFFFREARKIQNKLSE
ncbi:MAG: DUF3021 domain-containing protein [Eubacteriales bacterium]|nr:DUF3021 domain-containing protein [Eubacteriales bacterium]